MSLDLPGSLSSASEDRYRVVALNLLADHGIYAWKVHDERSLINTGASAETRDVVIFLAGGASLALTAELIKRIVAALERLGEHLLGLNEIDDEEAVAIAVTHRRLLGDYSTLRGFERTDANTRRMRFSDGLVVEVDANGRVISADAPGTSAADDQTP